jgi:hypothetical protein
VADRGGDRAFDEDDDDCGAPLSARIRLHSDD